MLLTQITHPQNTRRIPRSRSTRNESNRLPIHSKLCPVFRNTVPRKQQFHSTSVHPPARPHPLHYFLTGVATLGVTDMARPQSRFLVALLVATAISHPP